jgi:hypothetical protein
MRSRTFVIAACFVAASMMVLSACGGDDKGDDAKPSGPDRSKFEPITVEGVAAVVDRHLGDKVTSYSILSDESDGEMVGRSIEVTLRDADPQDSFVVTVYPENGSQGEVVKGDCGGASTQDDPQAKVTCTDAPDGGNVTITHFSFSLVGGNKNGSHITASGSGPEDREATVSYESFTKKVPISDKQLQAILGDPDLGWETDPAVNKAGKKLKVDSGD